MLVIHPKRIKIILSSLLLALFAFSFQMANLEPKTSQMKNTIQTTATPVSGKTVILDAGHGVPDERSRK